MKSIQLPLVAIFFLTIFTGPGGMAPLATMMRYWSHLIQKKISIALMFFVKQIFVRRTGLYNYVTIYIKINLTIQT